MRLMAINLKFMASAPCARLPKYESYDSGSIELPYDSFYLLVIFHILDNKYPSLNNYRQECIPFLLILQYNIKLESTV